MNPRATATRDTAPHRVGVLLLPIPDLPNMARTRPHLADFGQVTGSRREELHGQRVDGFEKIAERLDSGPEVVEGWMLFRKVESMVEDMEGRVQFATLAFGEDLAEQGPDLGLGAKPLTALTGAVDFVDDSPGEEFAEIHTDVAP